MNQKSSIATRSSPQRPNEPVMLDHACGVKTVHINLCPGEVTSIAYSLHTYSANLRGFAQLKAFAAVLLDTQDTGQRLSATMAS